MGETPVRMFNRHDISRNTFQLTGKLARQGYDWWWHSFTGTNPETGEKKSFFVEYFICNPYGNREKPVLGQSPVNKKEGRKPSYLMVKAGTWGNDAAQLHKFFGIRKIELRQEPPFELVAGECYLSEDALKGSVAVSEEDAKYYKEWMCDAGSMSWSLVMDKKIAFNVGYGAGRVMRRLNAFEMFWHAEGMKTAYKGEVLWNGKKYIVSPKDSYGYADKNWGSNFTSPWVWLSSCHMKSEITGKWLDNSAFDIGGGCPKIGRFALRRKLLAAFWHEGKEYEFNFSKFWTFCRTKFECRESRSQICWHVDQKTLRYRMVTDIVCSKKEMLLVNYESPDGQKRHNRLWNGGTGRGKVQLYRGKKLIDRIQVFNVGCEYGEYTK